MIAGLGEVETTTRTGYQGLKKFDTGSFRLTGGLMSIVAGGRQPLATITRLDRDLVWEIDHPNRLFHERTLDFSFMNDLSEKAEMEAEVSGTPGREFGDVAIDVKTPTGNVDTINGFPCTENTITMTAGLVDTVTGEEVSQTMTVTLWTTPLVDELVLLHDAEATFNEALFEKIAEDVEEDRLDNLGYEMLTVMYGVHPDDAYDHLEFIREEMEMVEGYPIVTEVKWESVGTGPEPGPGDEPEDEPAGLPTSLGGLKAGLTGMLARKAEEKVAEELAPSEPGSMSFSTYLEVKSVSADDLDPSDFELPEGYLPAE